MIFRLFLDHGFEARGEGTDQPVGEQNTEEGTHQRATDHLAKDSRWLVNRSHGLDHAHDGGNDPKGG